MKRLFCFLLSLLLVASFSTVAMAKSGGGGNGGGGGGKSGSAKNSAVTSKQGPQQKQIHAAEKNTTGTKSKATHYWQVKGDLQFYDIENHWAANAIRHLAKYGLVDGFADGTFQPDAPMTQAETVALIMRWVEIRDAAESTDPENPDEELTENPLLEDELEEDIEEPDEIDEEEAPAEVGDDGIPGWARHAIEGASTKGIVNINRFHSPVQTSRAQAAVWIAKAQGLTPVDTSTMIFSDGILIAPEDIGYILALQQTGAITGTSDGRFNPNTSITRAEMATIMDQILADQLAEQENITPDPAGSETPPPTDTEPPADPSSETGDDTTV